jgi:hypothetical protein
MSQGTRSIKRLDGSRRTSPLSGTANGRCQARDVAGTDAWAVGAATQPFR